MGLLLGNYVLDHQEARKLKEKIDRPLTLG